MVNVVFLVVAGLCLCAAALRQWSWRAGGRDGVNPVLPALVSLGLACLFIAPATQAVVSTVVPGIGRLLSNGFTLVAAFGFLELLGYLQDRPVDGRVRRRRLTVLAAVLAVLVVTFVLGQQVASPVGLFEYEGDIALTAYTVVYALYLGLTMARMLVLAVRTLAGTRRQLRIGMGLFAVGCVLGVAYSMSKIYGTLTAFAGLQAGVDRYCEGPFSRLGCTMSIGVPALSVGLIVLGLVVPFLVTGPAALGRWVTDARLARALRPLWLAMCDALPQIALTSPDAVRGRVPRLDASLRLYRRTVEVRDAALLLAPYRSPDDSLEHARRAERSGLVGEHARAAVEAADLRTAIERYRGESPAPRAAEWPDGPGDADDTRAEARWLARVSASFARGDVDPLSGVGQSGSSAR